MRYIDNYELREWVKESLKKSIFQKAHALAVQTGCEILVKLEDVADAAGPQYYATRNLQQAYRHGGVCEKPGERCVAGDTGLPTIRTAEIAIQSYSNEDLIREPVFSMRNTNNNHNPIQQTRTMCRANNPVVPSQIHTSQHANKALAVSQISQQQQQHKTNKVGLQGVQEQQNANIVPNNMSSTVSETQIDVNLSTEAPQTHKEVTTDTPVNVKMEVHNVEDDESIEKDVGYLDESDMVCNDDDDDLNTMAPLSHEEEFYDDHFGTSGEFDDSGSQSGSQSGMLPHPHPSGEIGSQFQHMTATGREMPAASSQPGTVGSHFVTKSATRMYKFSRTHSPPKPDHQSLTPDTVASMLTYPVTLPNFSTSVQYALENGHIHSGKMWSQFCKESSQFYQPLLDIHDCSPFHDSKTSSVVYQSIGRSMYEKYPCIAGKGIRPWTLFNKWLSTKIRQARFQAKKKDQEDTRFGSPSQVVNLPNS